MIDLQFGDCMELLKAIPANSVDLILSYPPYGTTANKWDSVLPLDKLWPEYWRIAKPNAAVVLTAQTPFDKILGVSELANLRYEWIWEKSAATGFLNSKKAPLKAHENVLVFYRSLPIYNPIKMPGHTIKRVNRSVAKPSTNYGRNESVREPYESTERYPRSVLKFPKDNRLLNQHPTQKPVALMEYFIRTYTNEGATVLDNTMGSGSTGVACINLNRSFIGMENDPVHFVTASDRIAAAHLKFIGGVVSSGR